MGKHKGHGELVKKFGFIRWKGFIPFIVIAVFVYVFSTLYLDMFLKRLIVKNATLLNGALVEIKSLRLSFLQSSLKIRNLAVTNPKNLMQNRFEVGNITFDFQFLPLLKKKFVTDEINITGVKWLTKRKYEGKIPKAWQRELEKKKSDSQIGQFVSESVANLTKSIKAELPDISVDSLKKKFDPREAIKVKELASYKKSLEIKDKAQNTYRNWDENTKKLVSDQKKFVDDMKNKLNSLNPKNIKTPQAIINSIQTVGSFKNDISSRKNLLTGKVTDVKREIESYTAELKSIPDLIKNDTESIVDKYSLGSFNIDNFSKQIFGMRWIPQFQKYVMYRNKFMAYYKRLNASKEEKVKKERFKGMNIAFPIVDGTPKFLVKKVYLSAETGKKEESNEIYRGRYDLKVNDVSSNQKLYGRPTTAELTLETFDGLFAKASLDLLLDYRDEPRKDKLSLDVEGFKLARYTLGKGSVFPMPLSGGLASARISGGSTGENVMFDIVLNINNAAYKFEKSKNYLLTLLQDIVKTIKNFRVDINFFGTLENPKFTIRSTLDNAIAKGLKKVFSDKMNEIRTKAEKYIRDEVNKNVAQAKQQISSLDSEAKKRLEDQLSKLDFLSEESEKKIDELKNRQKELVKDKLPGSKDVGKKLKGLFGK